MTVGIYILTNKCNNKVYVGQSWDVKNRLIEHSKVKKNGFYISNAINKHGWENFSVEIISVPSTIEQHTLNLLECKYISLNNSLIPFGYNLREGGSHGKFSASSRQKMSKAHLGQAAWDKGILKTKEQKQEISKATTGIKKSPRSEKHKYKISEFRKGTKIRLNSETGKREWYHPQI